MRALFIIGVLVISCFIACHKKAVPNVAERIEHPPAPAPVPVVPVATAPTPTPVPPEFLAGKTIYETKCIRCHVAKPVDKWTADGWKAILKSMIPKAKLNFIESGQLTAYVNQFAKKI